MSLTYNKLIEFNLLDDAEKELMQSTDKLMIFINSFQEILNTDKFIRDCPSFPASTKNIIRDELISAIGSTLAIEGIKPKEEEIKQTLDNPSREDNLKRIQREIVNSKNVYDYVRAIVDENKEDNFTYKVEHISRIHELFTENIQYFGNYPGRYRNANASFGVPRKISLCESWVEIDKAMDGFIIWLNRKSEGFFTNSVIAKAIMAHYYLTEIHPFGDGNGRTARAVEAMVLYANKMNPYSFWSLANFWSLHRNEYITHLGNIRDTYNPIDFIIWGAQGYLEEIQRVKERILKKVKQLMLQDYVRWLLDTKKYHKGEQKINPRILRIVELLKESDRVLLDKFRSSPEYKTLYAHSSNMTQIRDLTKMAALGLIKIVTEDNKNYIALNYSILEQLEYKV
ncbi:MAG: Fic family protein [Sedimentisphaerales bacterium]